MNTEGTTNRTATANAATNTHTRPARTMTLLAVVAPDGRLQPDLPGWPGHAWASDAAGHRWLAEFVHTADVPTVRAWLAETFADPIVARVSVGGTWHRVELAKVGQRRGWFVTSRPAA